LKIIGNSNWIKFSNWIVSFKYNRWIFPGRTRFYLRPWDFCIFSQIPLLLQNWKRHLYLLCFLDTSLYGRIFDFSIVNATNSTTAACSWFSSRLGAVQPGNT
jgi:hypothetical protein